MSGAIDINDLRRALRYEPETGKLFWRERPLSDFQSEHRRNHWNSLHAGRECFLNICGGYCHGSFKGKTLKGHRVAWAIVYGEWPDELDHINGDRLDNRIANLRCVDRRENCRNRAIGPLNTSGVMGVYWHKRNKRWIAHIGVGGVSRTLGRFLHKEDAIAARKQAEAELAFHPNHGRAA